MRNPQYDRSVTSRTMLVTALTVPIVCALAAIASAQRIWVGRGGFGRDAPKWAKRANFDGGFNYCRGYDTSDRREAGGMAGWTDYAGADNNFAVRLGERTVGRANRAWTGQPDDVVR